MKFVHRKFDVDRLSKKKVIVKIRWTTFVDFGYHLGLIVLSKIKIQYFFHATATFLPWGEGVPRKATKAPSSRYRRWYWIRAWGEENWKTKEKIPTWYSRWPGKHFTEIFLLIFRLLLILLMQFTCGNLKRLILTHGLEVWLFLKILAKIASRYCNYYHWFRWLSLSSLALATPRWCLLPLLGRSWLCWFCHRFGYL